MDTTKPPIKGEVALLKKLILKVYKKTLLSCYDLTAMTKNIIQDANAVFSIVADLAQEYDRPLYNSDNPTDWNGLLYDWAFFEAVRELDETREGLGDFLQNHFWIDANFFCTSIDGDGYEAAEMQELAKLDLEKLSKPAAYIVGEILDRA